MLYKLYNMSNMDKSNVGASFEQIPTSELRAKSAPVMRQLQNGGGPLCLTNYNKTVGYLVSADHFEPLAILNHELRNLAGSYTGERRPKEIVRLYGNAWLENRKDSRGPFSYLLGDMLENGVRSWARFVAGVAKLVAYRQENGELVEVVAKHGRLNCDLTSKDEVLSAWFSPITGLLYRDDMRDLDEVEPGEYVVELHLDDELLFSREVTVRARRERDELLSRVLGSTS